MKHRITFFLFKLVGIMLCALYWYTPYFWLLMTGYLCLGAAIAILGSYFIQWNYHITSINNLAQDGVAFTFDDGPDPKTTPKVLATLKEYGVKATFFLIGSKVKQHPQLVKKIVEEGHVVANHSYSHHNFIPFYTSQKLKKDFDQAAMEIEKACGKKPHWIRPPFGATSPRYYKMMRKKPFTSTGWSIRSMDTVEKSPDALANKVVSKCEKRQREIVLFHDTQEVTVKALPKIIEALKSKGIKIVSLENSIKPKPYV